ncbi:MAG: aminoglycoside phosphotransferase family protein [Actinomycetota bacterium]|nr:aminoglycoside phosphotransferase family protein [Actinomycetota bacterium]
MTEPDITTPVVAALVAAQFPEWADLAIRPVEMDGWDNRTFRLGEDMAVRLSSADAYAAQIDREHRWLPVLGPRLPLPVPEPLAQGAPSELFPWPWSVRRWLAGEPATGDRVSDHRALAADLAGFLTTLGGLDTTDAPPAGAHNFFRGGPLGVYDTGTREAIAALGSAVDACRAGTVWEAAVSTSWDRPGVWVHGDITPSNLLVSGGRLSAVIDFGCCAVGDPACDLAIAWTCFSGDSREVFKNRTGIDEDTWARARGLALWKALITLPEGPGPAETARVRFGWRWSVAAVIAQILNDVP